MMVKCRPEEGSNECGMPVEDSRASLLRATSAKAPAETEDMRKTAVV